MTNTTPTKIRFIKGAELKNFRKTCTHAKVITLHDGVRVCTACEAVLR